MIRGVLAAYGLAATVVEVWQILSDWLAWNAGPVAEVVPEFDSRPGGSADRVNWFTAN
jgi:hypothetical protein